MSILGISSGQGWIGVSTPVDGPGSGSDPSLADARYRTQPYCAMRLS